MHTHLILLKPLTNSQKKHAHNVLPVCVCVYTLLCIYINSKRHIAKKVNARMFKDHQRIVNHCLHVIISNVRLFP